MIGALSGITAYLRTQGINDTVTDRFSRNYINDIRDAVSRNDVVFPEGNFSGLQDKVSLSHSFSKDEFDHTRLLPMGEDLLIQFGKLDYRNTRSLNPLAKVLLENSYISRGSNVLELGAGAGFACSEVFKQDSTFRVHATSLKSPIAPQYPWKFQYIELLEIIRDKLEKREEGFTKKEEALYGKISEALTKLSPYGYGFDICGYNKNYLLDNNGIELILDLQRRLSYQCFDKSYTNPYIEKQFIGPLDDFVLDRSSAIHDYQYDLIYENYGPHKYLLEPLESKNSKKSPNRYFDNLISLISPKGIFLSMNSIIGLSLWRNFQRMRQENKIDKDAILVLSYDIGKDDFVLLINPKNKLCNLLKRKIPFIGRNDFDKERKDGIYYVTRENLEVIL